MAAQRPSAPGRGVSFGVSGTNAHLILEEAPAEASREPRTGGARLGAVVPLVVSARSAGSLAGQAGRLAAFLDGRRRRRWRGVAGAAGVRRAALSASVPWWWRGSRARRWPGCERWRAARPRPVVVRGVAPVRRARWCGCSRARVRSGSGWAGSCWTPRRCSRERIAECAAALAPWVDWSLVDVLRGETDPSCWSGWMCVQPAQFAVMVGLAAVWASVGCAPDAVVGHSQGEIAAACVAGALSLEDAARVVALRSQAIAGTLSGRGGMASVALGEDEAVARLAPWADRVEVAAVNGPSLGGDRRATPRRWTRRWRRCARRRCPGAAGRGGLRLAHPARGGHPRRACADALAGIERAGAGGAVLLDRHR